MKLFWCAKTRAFRILWLLEEAGLEYDLVPIDVRNPEGPRDPEFTYASPMGKVPAIADNGVLIADSSAIALYIADKYRESAQLAPGIDDVARGRYLYWMTYMGGVMEPAMIEKFQNIQPNKIAHGYGSFDLMIKTLEAGIRGHDWLMRDSFSAADVLVGSTVGFLKQFGILPESDLLDMYLERCQNRDAYKCAMAVEAENS